MANSQSFYFYDLETTGIDARRGRIMQFAGQRTDMDLVPVGEPLNVLIRLTPDVLPDAEAVLLTGITPQATLADGITEKEFLEIFHRVVVQPGTIFTGFNTVRFDDEFMRFLHYRNFYDAYEWQYCDGCSRWDLLDMVRMTRALRPDGIEWPSTDDGKPTNKLELLTTLNGLDHDQAHDALNDVQASIAVARLIRKLQPELFDYLFSMRDKSKVRALAESGKPFVYTSGRYDARLLHTTAAAVLAPTAQSGGSYVYDLRHDPAPFLDMTPEQLAEICRYRPADADVIRLPVKVMKYNRCPAVAPMGVVKDPVVRQRLQLDLEAVERHWRLLAGRRADFGARVAAAYQRLETDTGGRAAQPGKAPDVDGRLYEGFYDAHDSSAMRAVQQLPSDQLPDSPPTFHDERLVQLWPLYKARNFPHALTAEERQAWDEFCRRQLLEGGADSRLGRYFAHLEDLSSATALSDQQRFILEELKLYGESIVPSDADGQ